MANIHGTGLVCPATSRLLPHILFRIDMEDIFLIIFVWYGTPASNEQAVAR